MTDSRSPDAALAEIGARLASQSYVRRGIAVSDEIVRVVLVDDHTVVRKALKALLRTSPDVAVVGEAADGQEALEVVERLHPHVVVMDLDMPRLDGLAATREITSRWPDVSVLILTYHTEEERLPALLDAGACGYLGKDAADQELLDAIRVVSRGEVYVRPRVARVLANRIRHPVEPDDLRQRRYAMLSDREQMVFTRVAEGYNGREIGRLLGISPKTVDTYRQRIEEKLGISHRTEYVRLALELQLLHAEGPAADPAARPPR